MIKWFGGCTVYNNKTFSFSYYFEGTFIVCFVKFETVCSIPQEQVANKTLDFKQMKLPRNVSQG